MANSTTFQAPPGLCFDAQTSLGRFDEYGNGDSLHQDIGGAFIAVSSMLHIYIRLLIFMLCFPKDIVINVLLRTHSLLSHK